MVFAPLPDASTLPVAYLYTASSAGWATNTSLVPAEKLTSEPLLLEDKTVSRLN
jgi:hypothetical protein